MDMRISARHFKRGSTDLTYFVENGRQLGHIDNVTGEVYPSFPEAEPRIRAWLVLQDNPHLHDDWREPHLREELERTGAMPPPQDYSEPAAEPRKRLALADKVDPDGVNAVYIRNEIRLEETVADALVRGLPVNWTAYHSIPLGDPAYPVNVVQHLVVGPGGVYVLVDRDNGSDIVVVQGDFVRLRRKEERYSHIAHRELIHVETRLGRAFGSGVPVEPVVVFIGEGDVVVNKQHYGIPIMSIRDLPLHPFLHPLRPRFKPYEVDRLNAIVRAPGAWV